MQHFEHPVAEIDAITFAHQAGRRRRRTDQLARVEASMRQGRDERCAHLVPGPLYRCDELDRMIFTVQTEIGTRCSDLVGFGVMHDAIRKLVQRADVVDVCMGCNRGHRFVEQVLRGLVQAGDSHAAVDHQVAVTSAHMPDVALLEADDMRLPDEGDVVGDPFEIEPAGSDWKCHGADLTLSERGPAPPSAAQPCSSGCRGGIRSTSRRNVFVAALRSGLRACRRFMFLRDERTAANP